MGPRQEQASAHLVKIFLVGFHTLLYTKNIKPIRTRRRDGAQAGTDLVSHLINLSFLYVSTLFFTWKMWNLQEQWVWQGPGRSGPRHTLQTSLSRMFRHSSLYEEYETYKNKKSVTRTGYEQTSTHLANIFLVGFHTLLYTKNVKPTRIRSAWRGSNTSGPLTHLVNIFIVSFHALLYLKNVKPKRIRRVWDRTWAGARLDTRYEDLTCSFFTWRMWNL